MINYETHTLSNGLKVIVHQDKSTPVVAMNILYKVGARDENPEKTGFAHLFEHLMFGGSKNIPKYDTPLEITGGENNAFTNNDFTNYYLTLPKQNLETAFWLESDRMFGLNINEKSLAVQQQVVIEEFKQRYLNQPYGDAWLKFRPLAYQVHPYRWPTIGMEIRHIEDAKLEDVQAFYSRYYRPNNAILVLSGDVNPDEIIKLSEKWFGQIPAGEAIQRNIPKEPEQTEKRTLSISSDVPLDAIYMSWHMVDRNHPDYHATDLISDLLSNGESARLYQKLVKETELFNDITAFISGDYDPGFFMITGKLNTGTELPEAEKAILDEIENLKTGLCSADELQKIKNKAEASQVFSEINVLNKAMNLAFFEFISSASDINKEGQKYQKVQREDIQRISREMFRNENLSVLYYKKTEGQTTT